MSSSKRSSMKLAAALAAEEEGNEENQKRKSLTALTPEERRARAIRAEQKKEEKEKERKLIEKLKEEKRRSMKSPSHSSSPSPVGGEAGDGPLPDDNTVDSSTIDQTIKSDAELEAEILAEIENENKKEEDNYDIIIDPAIKKSPLIQATIENNLLEVKQLIHTQPIEFRVEYVNQVDENGCTAIFFALSPEHYDLLNYLLDHGSNPNHQNNKKYSVLHMLCLYNNKKSCKLMIDYGANINIENWQYQQPHSMMKEHDKISIMQLYLNTMLEQYQEKIKQKAIFPTDACTRSYYRSIFDITDTKNFSFLRYEDVIPLLRQMSVDPSVISEHFQKFPQTFATPAIPPNITEMMKGMILKQDEKYTYAWFQMIDTDKNGVWSFNEFLYVVMIGINEKMKAKKKAQKLALAKARKAKKKDADNEKESARQSMATASREARSQAASNINSPIGSPR